ncbi:olfactory receptor 8H1-like [Choloepus didactylus]|uniref:olfactory receptor 8H1-like n=1 Tax=Choloepus didactylus TaxID=27675 RepID=UPI0018A00FC1|nr:olfactory receptor 8H1-like [Choloepus didactylus]
MGSRNNTNIPDFILMGLTDSEETQCVLFLLFLLMYLISLLGNAGMILIIHLDLQLHTPMYFFLSHLSFLDLSNSTIIIPKTLENLQTSNKYISFIGCFTQMYFCAFLTVSEFFLLSSMAYDRYVAICNPLQYPVVMSRRLCSTLITVSYLIGGIESLAIVLYINSLHFCNSNVISHFFCDITPVLALSCTVTLSIEIMIIIFASFNVMFTFITISVSYGSILCTILKINSTSGKHKAFSTCASHLLGISIFYGTTIFIYIKPKKSYSLGKDQVSSVFYTMVVPMLNPFIYSLRNREVKNALIRVMQKRKCSRQLK